MSLQAGTYLGPYDILAPLGAGGMGEVWKARDTRLDRFVTVQVLPEHPAKDPEALARLEREAKAMAALNHPNITGIFDIGNVERLDLATGRRTRMAQITPPDPAGVPGIQGVFLSPTGTRCAYNFVRRLSQLCTIEGLK